MVDRNEQNTGNGLPQFKTSPLREKVLGEVHARPFRPLRQPRTVLHFAFLTNSEEAAADQEWFSEFCSSRGAPGPAKTARYHTTQFGEGTLSWELHAEFVTYTWDGPADQSAIFGKLPDNHPFGAAFRAPGELLDAVRIDLRADDGEGSWRERFDATSLSACMVNDGTALVATDFRQDGDGFTRILVLNRSMEDVALGAVIQRLLEVETYRTLAMIGLFETGRLQPDITRIERDLAEITDRMRELVSFEANRDLLAKLTALAAALEADAAATTFRFGATRAYYEIVKARLTALKEQPLPGDLSLTDFLNRRLAPAMRTCQTLEQRLTMLSEKLARATTLLRTRVDVDLEQQNRTLLESMNRRARLQLRLQQTVEGLSVAAVSYYVVGLIAYLAKAVKAGGLPMPDPGVTTGLAVPVVVLAIWYTVRRIRAHHAE